MRRMRARIVVATEENESIRIFLRIRNDREKLTTTGLRQKFSLTIFPLPVRCSEREYKEWYLWKIKFRIKLTSFRDVITRAFTMHYVLSPYRRKKLNRNIPLFRYRGGNVSALFFSFRFVAPAKRESNNKRLTTRVRRTSERIRYCVIIIYLFILSCKQYGTRYRENVKYSRSRFPP